ncbi:hypothetical protein L1887_37831 [Cichorium endivia]|nr:hypothetical protein L1887_37831 [Cichorium endivia]
MPKEGGVAGVIVHIEETIERGGWRRRGGREGEGEEKKTKMEAETALSPEMRIGGATSVRESNNNEVEMIVNEVRGSIRSNTLLICHVRSGYPDSRATKPPSTSLIGLQHVRPLFPLTCHINLRSIKLKKVNHKTPPSTPSFSASNLSLRRTSSS